jgi:hypothetical protein
MGAARRRDDGRVPELILLENLLPRYKNVGRIIVPSLRPSSNACNLASRAGVG